MHAAIKNENMFERPNILVSENVILASRNRTNGFKL